MTYELYCTVVFSPRGAIDGDGVQHFVVCQRLPRLQRHMGGRFGEELDRASEENGNRTDSFAVAVVKSVEGTTVTGISWTKYRNRAIHSLATLGLASCAVHVTIC